MYPTAASMLELFRPHPLPLPQSGGGEKYRKWGYAGAKRPHNAISGFLLVGEEMIACSPNELGLYHREGG
jgi:hypothetical protein